MTNRVSNRHEDDLGGKCLPFGDTKQVDVTVAVDPDTACLPSTQHTAWMLLNLLLRQEGVVHRVHLSCPENVPLASRIVPLSQGNTDLRSALLEGGQAIGVVPIDDGRAPHFTIVVGADSPQPMDGDLYVYGNHWVGGISKTPIALASLGPSSHLPFGPYTGACMANAEIFKAARMRPELLPDTSSAFYSVWQHRASPLPLVDGPNLPEISVNAVLAGVGAVGCAFLHTLWAMEGARGLLVLADNDNKGLETTNLNRYALFGTAAVGEPKATAAAKILSTATINWQPHDSAVESLPKLPPRIVSAVDRNSSRRAIQNRYPPRILSGSTLDLRAEVLRCGPPGKGACLRCFNPPEVLPPDDELRERFRRASDDQLAQLAQTAGISLQDAREWLSTGRCGRAGERLLPLLRSSEETPTFAVGFVSVMAGTMLAAEFIKDHVALEGPLSESAQRAVFQFHLPLASSNRASVYTRDPACPMCDPSTIACTTWAERFNALAPQRT
jgi:ThiF family